jgi:hypothetical protein
MTDGTDRDGARPGRTNAERRAADGGVPAGSADRQGGSTASPERGHLHRPLARIAGACEAGAYRWVQLSFAFVFLYFGLQKWPIVQGASPVRPPVRAFVEAVGFGGWIPLAPEVGLLSIGIYEATLGALWFATLLEERRVGSSRLFVAVALLTVAHQLVTFLPLVVVPEVAFRQTRLWLPLVGTAPFAVALDWLSAFILKNLLFLGALLYYVAEWADRYGPGRSDGSAQA